MNTLILARHGETDWNRHGIWQGHGDPPLNDLGRQQAARLARRLAGARVDAIYASDLRRARETAEVVSEALGLPVLLEPGLREMDVGSWTGLTLDEIRTRFPGSEDHDGETRHVFDARAVAALHRIASAHAHSHLLVVSHGGVARAFQRHVLGAALPLLGNGETETYRFESGRFTRLD